MRVLFMTIALIAGLINPVSAQSFLDRILPQGGYEDNPSQAYQEASQNYRNEDDQQLRHDERRLRGAEERLREARRALQDEMTRRGIRD